MMTTFQANAGNTFFRFGSEKAAPSPCDDVIQMEESQLKIMREVRAKIIGDKADETYGAVKRSGDGVAVGVESGAGALGSLADGEWKLAAIQGLIAWAGFASAKNNAEKAGQEIAEGKAKVQTINGQLEQRSAFVDRLKKNPAMCGDDVKAALFLNYVRDTKILNDFFIQFTEDYVGKMQPGVYSEMQISGGVFVVAGIVSVALFKFLPASSGRLILIPATTTVLTVASGGYLAKKLVVDLRLLNGLKSDVIEMKAKNEELLRREGELKQRLGLP